jgi:exonuclease VII small subunit
MYVAKEYLEICKVRASNTDLVDCLHQVWSAMHHSWLTGIGVHIAVFSAAHSATQQMYTQTRDEFRVVAENVEELVEGVCGLENKVVKLEKSFTSFSRDCLRNLDQVEEIVTLGRFDNGMILKYVVPVSRIKSSS